MFSKRVRSVGIICFFIMLALSARLVYICSVKGNAYKAMTYTQQQKEITVKKTRAAITDKNGISFTDRKNKNIYLSSKGTLLTEDENSVFTFAAKSRFPVLASHLTGYTASDSTGLCGIEKLYDSELKNKGKINLGYMADAAGAPLDSFFIKEYSQNDQREVRLTLDYHIQKIAEEVMNKYITKGAAVILDVQSFDVLAMVSRPSFDGENAEKYQNSQNGELLNRALLGYNAGSVFKIITAAAALEKDSSFAKRYFDCQGTYDIPGVNTFHCHKKDGHGILSFDDAFAASCNCCFYVTGLETKASDIMTMAQRFGIGSRLLNADLGESAGNLPQRSMYTASETLNLSIGQGEILVTPLQCASMAATVANGGVRKDVNVVSGVVNKNGEFENVKTTESQRVISSSTALLLSSMMRECVLYGTGTNAAASSVSIAGKTGSAESGWIENGTPLVHGWFCGFFPYESPRYAMAILAEGGHSGADSCIEPFVEIAEKINEIYPLKQ